jgi:hypothetical protein
VLVDGRQTLFEAHALTETIEGVIQQIVPHADVTVHPEPYSQAAAGCQPLPRVGYTLCMTPCTSNERRQRSSRR